MRISNQVELYHKVEKDNDMPEHTIGTTDSLFQGGLGGSFDGETDTDANALTVQEYVQSSAAGAVSVSGIDVTALQLIVIKHTGFTDSTQTETTTDRVKIGIGGQYDGGRGASIGAGGCFIMPYPSSTVNKFEDYEFESTGSDTVYVQLTRTR